MEDLIQQAVITVFEEIKKSSNGTETSISELLKKSFPNLDFSIEDKFKIEIMVREKAEAENIILDKSKYEGALVGLPFNIPFVKKC